MTWSFVVSFLSQPVVLVCIAVLVAFGLGVLQPWSWFGQPSTVSVPTVEPVEQKDVEEHEGPSWLENALLFVPRLFIDVLDIVHTKRFRFYGLILALLAIEAFFAFRAAVVYYDVLSVHVPSFELVIVCIIVFVAIFLCGYMVATHDGKFTKSSFLTAALVVFHDWAGTIYMNYSVSVQSVKVMTPVITNGWELFQALFGAVEPLKLILTIGMCALGLLPFVMGQWAEELRPLMAKELDEEINEFTNSATRKIKRRAVNMVLRRVSRTDVVLLVNALPKGEFDDFKSFVMPIIAPNRTRLLAKSPSNVGEMSVEYGSNMPGDVSVVEEKLPVSLAEKVNDSSGKGSLGEDGQAERSEPVTEKIPVFGGNLIEIGKASSTVGDGHGNVTSDDASKNGSRSATDAALQVPSSDHLSVIRNYPLVVGWFEKKLKSVTPEEIVAATKQPKKRVLYQIGKALKLAPNSRGKILVSTVMNWLIDAPLPNEIALSNGEDIDEIALSNAQDSEENIDKLAIALEALRINRHLTDEDLADLLGLKRPASARFWRLKAQMLLEQSGELMEQSLEYAVS
jgi:hypothetical protein